MDKGKEHLVKGIIYEYDNSIVFLDGEVVAQQCEITEIRWNEETDELEYYTGDMKNTSAIQVFPNETEIEEIFDIIVNNF
jgi:hypothetical protein